jgi:hypothetical protein
MLGQILLTLVYKDFQRVKIIAFCVVMEIKGLILYLVFQIIAVVNLLHICIRQNFFTFSLLLKKVDAASFLVRLNDVLEVQLKCLL